MSLSTQDCTNYIWDTYTQQHFHDLLCMAHFQSYSRLVQVLGCSMDCNFAVALVRYSNSPAKWLFHTVVTGSHYCCYASLLNWFCVVITLVRLWFKTGKACSSRSGNCGLLHNTSLANRSYQLLVLIVPTSPSHPLSWVIVHKPVRALQMLTGQKLWVTRS